MKEAVLQHGEVICGRRNNLYRLLYDGERGGQAGAAAYATPRQRLLERLRSEYQPLYAILDAARDIRFWRC